MTKEPVRSRIPLPEYAIKNLFNLRTERKQRKLRQRDVAKLSGVAKSMITIYENAKKPRKNYAWRNYQRLADFFGWKQLDFNSEFYRGLDIFYREKKVYHYDYSDLIIPPKNIVPGKKAFSFVDNKIYTIIFDKLHRDDFCYLGMIGRCHVFKNIYSSWFLSQTDAQLIGKKIQLKQEG